MKDARLVWSDEDGDLRKKKSAQTSEDAVDEKNLVLKLRRLSAGKGRTVIEISGLPSNQKWCKDLASELKKSLGIGGSYKNNIIELQLDQLEKVTTLLEKKSIKHKKIGG